MKAVVLYGAIKKYDSGLSSILQIVYNTLKELGIEIGEIKLGEMNLPYYSGAKNDKVSTIMQKIKDSQAIIFATTVEMFSPSSALKQFLEYFENAEYKDVLNGRNCMTVVAAKGAGERETCEYLSRVIMSLGGSQSNKIGLSGKYINALAGDDSLKEIVEKEVEDYYRIFRQNRKFLPSSESIYVPEIINTPSINIVPKTLASAAKSDYSYFNETVSADTMLFNIQPDYSQPEYSVNNLSYGISDTEYVNGKPVPKEPEKVIRENISFENFSSQQENDIAELSRFFENKISNFGNTSMTGQASKSSQQKKPITYNKPLPPDNININVMRPAAQQRSFDLGAQPQHNSAPVVYRAKTCKQMTLSLPHYYQPHLAKDVECIIQLSVLGDEKFDCYLIMKNIESRIIEGIHPSPDISILTDCNVWSEILKGRYTAQKAFMSGQLKVRGNFMLLNKFDTLYKKMS